MKLDKSLFDSIAAKAAQSPRLRHKKSDGEQQEHEAERKIAWGD